MRYIKFLQIPINTSGGFNIINNDPQGKHWLFLTFINLQGIQNGADQIVIQLKDPFGNVYDMPFFNYTQTTGTASYLAGQLMFYKEVKGIFLPYNWQLSINGNIGNVGTLNFIVMAFDSLEELFDYLYGNAK